MVAREAAQNRNSEAGGRDVMGVADAECVVHLLARPQSKLSRCTGEGYRTVVGVAVGKAEGESLSSGVPGRCW